MLLWTVGGWNCSSPADRRCYGSRRHRAAPGGTLVAPATGAATAATATGAAGTSATPATGAGTAAAATTTTTTTAASTAPTPAAVSCPSALLLVAASAG